MNDALPGLDQLRELPLPAAISYWPATWGWAVVAIVLLAGGVWSAVAIGRRHCRNRYRRQALAELDRLTRIVSKTPLEARALPALLKRTALAAQVEGQQARVAPLSGNAWLAYLNQDAASHPFTDDAARLLATLAYGTDATVQSVDPAALGRLLAASRQWMERHHVAA
ncbi:DUF4381 domain-containing protein [Bordetella tumulicola]|uniref:DUF4381 domain-containing protein n=1 Tax=Bordetella tumulicola TaxID=1649133 RepID=UPI0039F10BC7